MAKSWFGGTIQCSNCRQPLQLVTRAGQAQTYIHLNATPEPHEATPAGDDVRNWHPKASGGALGYSRKKQN